MALLRHSPRNDFWGDFVPGSVRLWLRAEAHGVGDRDTFTKTGSWRRSRSEPISLTGTESGGVSIDRDGEAALEPKLRGLG